MRTILAGAAVLAGCSWVYDAQYDTRAGQLEQSRQLFLPGTAQVQFLMSSDKKLYWVDVMQPQAVQQLHSYDPASGTKIVYTFPQGSISASQYHVSDAFVVQCGSPIIAFDANQPNSMIAMSTTGGSLLCAVTNSSVYFITEDQTSSHIVLDQWVVGPGSPTTVADLNTIVPNGSSSDIAGVGVVGNLIVLETQLGALWTIDTAHGFQQTWLMNPAGGSGEVSGTVTFDDEGVAYVAAGSITGTGSGGPTFTRYADKSSVLIEKGIDDGGYDMNFEHNDIQTLDPDNNEFTLTQHHLVYRAKQGIFAYGFDTTKVVDLLLDRKAGDFGFKPRYRTPVVAGSTLFVQDLGDDGSGVTDHPVYSVDLTARLR